MNTINTTEPEFQEATHKLLTASGAQPRFEHAIAVGRIFEKIRLAAVVDAPLDLIAELAVGGLSQVRTIVEDIDQDANNA